MNCPLQRIVFSGILAVVAVIGTGCAGRPVAGNKPSTNSVAGSQAPRTLNSAEAESSPLPPALLKNAEATAEYHFSLAQSYVAEGNPDRAIEEFKLVLTYDPESPLVYTRIATEYIKKGSFSAAMDACKEALNRDSKFTDARLVLAGLLAATHENAAALKQYEEILKQEPRHEEAIVYRAQLLVEDGQASLAGKQLHVFLKSNSESALAWFYLGKAEQRQDHFVKAVEAFKKAIELRPGFAQATLSLGYLYETQKKNREATQVYQQLYDQTQDLTAANRLATLYLKEERYKEAIPYLESIEAADPDDLNVRVKLGLVHMELKNYERSIELFKAILARNPESDRILYYLGSLYEETKKQDLAVQSLLKITPDSRLYGDAVIHVAYIFRQDGKIGMARDLVNQGIKKSPRISSFYLFQASLEEEAKNLTGAAEILEAAIIQFPEEEKARYYLGSIYDRLGKTDKSLAQMEAILRLNPENVDALNYVGYTWTQQGVRLNDAEKMLSRALKLKPENGYIRDSWGWHLFVRGRVREAVVELEKAVKLKPTEPAILEHLADVYLRLNLREKALQEYEEAARHAEDDGTRKKLTDKAGTIREELARREKTPREKSDRLPASRE